MNDCLNTIQIYTPTRLQIISHAQIGKRIEKQSKSRGLAPPYAKQAPLLRICRSSIKARWLVRHRCRWSVRRQNRES